MSTVYQHQLHAHKPHRTHYKRWAAVAVVLVVAVVVGLNFLKPNTKITQAKVVTKTINTTSPVQTFRKGTFSMQLPTGWQFMGVQKDIYTIYHFRSALSGDKGNRLVDVYEDSSLPNFPINRMIPVEATQDGGLTADSAHISENCTNYTTGGAGSQSQTGQLAKWQGIEFMCDMVNPLRNVVGIGSTDGRNTVNVNSLSGKHHYFMTYTENNDKPDYSVFVAAINSFKVAQ